MKKTAVVTGAYGGMGKATVAALACAGYRVFALDINVEEGNENIIPFQVDVTDEMSVYEAFHWISEMIDKIDVLIHFAGIYMLDSLVEMEKNDFEKIFKINLGGVYLVNKTFLPLLGAGSRILITTSELAPLDPLPFTGIYAVTKSALDKYAYSLRMELQLLGVDVSVLRAGAVDTGMIGVSLEALAKFHEKTKIYACNADRFSRIVNRVESRKVQPRALADKVIKIIRKKRSKFAYTINRNPLLYMLNALPKGLQLWIIKQILKDKKN